MDKGNTAEHTTWKSVLSYQIDGWSNSISYDDETSSKGSDLIFYSKEYSEHLAKIEYSKLSDEEKEIFLETIIKQTVKSKAEAILKYILQDSDKYQKIQNAFDSVEKCNSYIENNIPQAISFVERVQNLAKLDLEDKFEPSFFEQILEADKSAKHAKVAGTTAKATISLLAATGTIVKQSAIAKIILASADITNVILSALHFTNSVKTAKNIPDMEEIKELSDQFICMTLICKPGSLLNLTEESTSTLIKFYSSFMHQTIKSYHYGDQDISEYLLDQISNSTYIDSIGLKNQSNSLLKNKNGEEFTISSFISSQNKIACYNSLLETLSKEVKPQAMIINNYHHELVISGTTNEELPLNNSSNNEEQGYTGEMMPIDESTSF